MWQFYRRAEAAEGLMTGMAKKVPFDELILECLHMCAFRICWLISFFIGVAAAAYLINAVWDNYRKNPVIVSFMPMETEIKDIPFPAVTFCNMNRFPKSLYLQILK